MIKQLPPRSKVKMPDRMLKELKQTAAKMPNTMYMVLEPQEISGADLLLAGTEKVEGVAVDPEKTYHMKVPAFYPVNHLRQMKNIFYEVAPEKGEEAAVRFIKNYIEKTVREHLNEQN
jgi:hypothetical protein